MLAAKAKAVEAAKAAKAANKLRDDALVVWKRTQQELQKAGFDHKRAADNAAVSRDAVSRAAVSRADFFPSTSRTAVGPYVS